MQKNTKDLTLMKCYQRHGICLLNILVQKIYIDGANPSFIKSLKMQWGERPDYENVKKNKDSL